ncbi:MAG: hypothetical protein M1839_006227 [Geoglossum umbratile]|nr:MAG: hypothetical protein M1839_006227 [Geoglossum umbratile]
MGLANEVFWRNVRKVPKLGSAYDISGYYAWSNGIQNAVNSGLSGGWGFATGSIEYPSKGIEETETGRPIYPALKSVVDEGLEYLMMYLPRLKGQDNYLEWRGSMRVFTDVQGLYGFLDGSVLKPTEEGGAQSPDDTPAPADKLLDVLSKGLRNWREGKLERLRDDQKVWLLADKLAICAIYNTCSVAIQRSLSGYLNRDELRTSHDVLQHIKKEYGPPKCSSTLYSHLKSIKRERYNSFHEFALSYGYALRAFEDANLKIDGLPATMFCVALGDGVENEAARQAVIRFLDERKAAGQDEAEVELGDIFAVAQRAEKTYQARHHPSRRGRGRKRGGRR